MADMKSIGPLLAAGAGATALGGLALALLLRSRSNETSAPSPILSPHSPTVGLAPTGKGVFIRSVKHAGANPTDLVQWCVKLGLKWVTILALWQEADKLQKDHFRHVPPYAAALRANGIKVWLWGWPESRPTARAFFAKFMSLAAQKIGAEGYIINAEKPYYARGGVDYLAAARDLVAQCRAQYQGRIGFTSYGGGQAMHPGFPWIRFAELDFGLPQIYDTYHRLSKSYPTVAFQQWAKMYGRDNLVPVWGASNAHTPAQMADIISRTPFSTGACWWDLYWLTKSSARAKVVADFKIGAPRVAGDPSWSGFLQGLTPEQERELLRRCTRGLPGGSIGELYDAVVGEANPSRRAIVGPGGDLWAA